MPEKPYDNSANYYEFWETPKLKAEAASLHNLIHVEDCFSTKDVLRLELVERELDRRGISMHTKTSVEFEEHDTGCTEKDRCGVCAYCARHTHEL